MVVVAPGHHHTESAWYLVAELNARLSGGAAQELYRTLSITPACLDEQTADALLMLVADEDNPGASSVHDAPPPLVSQRKDAAAATSQLVVVEGGGAKGGDAYNDPTEAAQRLFNAIDRDGNGVLTRAEVIRTIRDAARSNNTELLGEMRDLLGLPPSVQQEDESHVIFERVFQAMDADDDRSITLSEFAAYIAQNLPATHGVGTAADSVTTSNGFDQGGYSDAQPAQQLSRVQLNFEQWLEWILLVSMQMCEADGAHGNKSPELCLAELLDRMGDSLTSAFFDRCVASSKATVGTQGRGGRGGGQSGRRNTRGSGGSGQPKRPRCSVPSVVKLIHDTRLLSTSFNLQHLVGLLADTCTPSTQAPSVVGGRGILDRSQFEDLLRSVCQSRSGIGDWQEMLARMSLSLTLAEPSLHTLMLPLMEPVCLESDIMHNVMEWLRLTFDRRATHFAVRQEALMTTEDLVLFFTDFDVMMKPSEESGADEGKDGIKDGDTLLTVENLHTLLWNLFFFPHGGKLSEGEPCSITC